MYDLVSVTLNIVVRENPFYLPFSLFDEILLNTRKTDAQNFYSTNKIYWGSMTTKRLYKAYLTVTRLT